MSTLSEIIPAKEIPDSAPWLSLRKGDAHQMAGFLVVGDQWFSISGFCCPYHPNKIEFFMGQIIIDYELDALLLLPPSRIGRTTLKGFAEVLKRFPRWDKTRWAFEVWHSPPYSQCWPQFRYTLWDCKPDKFDNEETGYNGFQMVEHYTEETEELQRRFSEKRVSGKYAALPDVEGEEGTGRGESPAR